LKKPEFAQLIAKLAAVFPGAIPDNMATVEAWYAIVSDLDAGRVANAVISMIQEVESLKFGANVGAMIRNRVNPLVTVSIVEGQLQTALGLNRSKDGDPYAYLKSIDPKLLATAENSDLFNRDLGAEALGFRMREVARQYMELRENAKRGFAPAKLTLVPKLSAPEEVKRPTNEEQLKSVKSLLDSIAGRKRLT
jgi:hypothetical protein